eukprot:1136303-Pelagomonas_calceolata.AAC.1
MSTVQLTQLTCIKISLQPPVMTRAALFVPSSKTFTCAHRSPGVGLAAPFTLTLSVSHDQLII